MAVPKRKVSRSRRDMRSANKGITPLPFSYCHEGSCEGTPRMPHQVCALCGFYKGKKVIRTKLDRALSRNEVRQAEASRRQAQEPAPETTEQN